MRLEDLDPTRVSPGVPGFVVTFALALACWLLARSLTKHLRRMNHTPEPTADGERGESAGLPSSDAGAELPTAGENADLSKQGSAPADGAS